MRDPAAPRRGPRAQPRPERARGARRAPTTARCASTLEADGAAAVERWAAAARGRALRPRVRQANSKVREPHEPHPRQRPARRPPARRVELHVRVARAQDPLRARRPRACARTSATPSCSTRRGAHAAARDRDPAGRLRPARRRRRRRCSSATDTTTHCPFKGDASYWSLRVGDDVREDAVWAYEDAARRRRRGCAGFAALYCRPRRRAGYVEDEPRRTATCATRTTASTSTRARARCASAPATTSSPSRRARCSLFETSLPGARVHPARATSSPATSRRARRSTTLPVQGRRDLLARPRRRRDVPRRGLELRAAARRGDEDRRPRLLRARTASRSTQLELELVAAVGEARGPAARRCARPPRRDRRSRRACRARRRPRRPRGACSAAT